MPFSTLHRFKEKVLEEKCFRDMAAAAVHYPVSYPNHSSFLPSNLALCSQEPAPQPPPRGGGGSGGGGGRVREEVLTRDLAAVETQRARVGSGRERRERRGGRDSEGGGRPGREDRKSTRLNSSH